jgi:glycosyltransferase involved in cell wall biosynthesis
MWNAPFYGSCDLIMGISKQSDNIHREVLKQNNFEVINYDNKKERDQFKYSNTTITGYVPHGLNHNIFKPLDKTDESYKKMYKEIKQDNNVDFVLMWNNRNIRRKQPGDVVLAFKTFVDGIPKEDRSKVALLMHTQATDNNGTDLRAIHTTIAPNYKIIFSEGKLSTNELNAMYNVVDVVINIASNEGWGLSSTEAMLAGTPIINNVTGGLQDQCGFLDEHGNWLQFDGEFSTNHIGKYKRHGRWVNPVFPSNRSMQGSPATPYIFDDRAKFEDVAAAMMKWWETPGSVRKECGEEGRMFCLDNGLTAKQMGSKMIEMINHLFETPKQPKLRYTLNKVTTKKYEKLGIVCEQ